MPCFLPLLFLFFVFLNTFSSADAPVQVQHLLGHPLTSRLSGNGASNVSKPDLLEAPFPDSHLRDVDLLSCLEKDCYQAAKPAYQGKGVGWKTHSSNQVT